MVTPNSPVEAASELQEEPQTEVASSEVVLPPSPLELVEQAVSEIPELAPVQNELVIIFVCSTQYVGTDRTPPAAGVVTPDIALEELSLAQSWDRTTIQQACERVMQVLADIWSDLTMRYDEATDRDPTETKILHLAELSQRLSSEQDEQSALIQEAHSLLAMVANVRNKLNLVKPEPVVATRDKEVEEESRGSRLVGNLRALGGKIGGAVVSPIYRVESDEELELVINTASAHVPPPSWKTTPVLNLEDQDIRRFKGVIVRRAQAADDASHAWRGLHGLGLSDLTVTEITDSVEKIAQAQIEQSEKIMREVSDDYGEYRDEIEANQRIRSLLQSVNNFFFPKV